MNAIRNWIRGWYETLHIRIFTPGTYRFLRDYRFNPEDFTEVDEP